MPQYLSPRVYVEEVEAGSRPIEGVGTAVAGFIGFAAKGPVNKPTLVANWTQFVSTFGGFMPGAYLAHGVFGLLILALPLRIEFARFAALGATGQQQDRRHHGDHQQLALDVGAGPDRCLGRGRRGRRPRPVRGWT